MRTPATLVLAAALALGGVATPAHAMRGDLPEPAPTVVAISVDGLSVTAIEQLGATGAPTLYRMLEEGAGTLNARSGYEMTVTLPNHTSMVTGRRIDASAGGHGVTWNDDRPGTTVQAAAGHPVGSVFSQVHAAGGTSALYSTKSKFRLFDRSWPSGVDTVVIKENQGRLVQTARADLADGAPTFLFLHVSLPDRAGHEYGGMSEQYLTAVRRTDAQLGTVLSEAELSGATVILTSDHGFATGQLDHAVRTDPENFTIAFLVWGVGVDHGDLYAMNPELKDPETRRPSYARKQPVRNGAVANLALSLLGLPAVPDSGIDPSQELVVGD